ncbi:unnamed protein product [Rhodiola kirilowii]
MKTSTIQSSVSLISRINGVKSIPYVSRVARLPSSSYSCSRGRASPRPLFMASAAQTAPPNLSTSDAANVFELVQSHQKKAARLPPVEEIRTVLDSRVRGMLSTISQKYEGYPSGSMVDYACDVDGYPILAISSLAIHTQDLLANPKCSLLVAKDPEDRTDLVITLHGNAVSLSVARATYLKKHPNAFWVDFGDFQFLRIEPTVVRYVSGQATAVARIGGFSKEEYASAKPDPIAQYSKPVASHMNADHEEDTKLIVHHSTSIPVDSAIILDLDSLGFNVKAGYQGTFYKLRIPFPRRAEDRKDVKTLIVEMLQAANATIKAPS